MSLVRKVFWPTALAMGLLLLLAASGNGTWSMRTAEAGHSPPREGSFCLIFGPDVIRVGEATLYLAYINNGGNVGHTTVSLDNMTGRTRITSLVDGTDSDARYRTTVAPGTPLSATEVNALPDFRTWAFGLEGSATAPSGISELLAARFPGFSLSVNPCGASTATQIKRILLNWIKDREGGLGLDPAVQAAVIDAVAASVAADIDGAVAPSLTARCATIGDNAGKAAIGAGASSAVALTIEGFIKSLCEGKWDVADAGDRFLDRVVIVDVTCTVAGRFDITFTDEAVPRDAISKAVECRGAPASAQSTITAFPTTVEIVPAIGSVAHSLIEVRLIDRFGQPADIRDVDFLVDRCAIETSTVLTSADFLEARTLFRGYLASVASTAAAIESSRFATTSPDATRQADSAPAFATRIGPDDFTVAAAILHCEPGHAVPNPTPGVATITAIINNVSGDDIVLSTTVTVVGPPAAITAAASPTTLRCGEKATITATVRDSIGQNVSDHTRVEAVTNVGGVLAGTGAVAGQAGPVVPLSSTVAETFGGVATLFLLTSEQHSGPYEVVITSGGSGAVTSLLGGIFSTPPVTTQVTVTCTIPTVAPAPAPVVATPVVTAPRTGTGITPPNTGDAGLADASGNGSSLLWLAAGALAFALAGVATLRFARR